MTQLSVFQKYTLFLTLLLVPSKHHCNNNGVNSTFLWTSLLDVPDKTFSSAFLPTYVNFTKDVLKNEQVSGACRVTISNALEALASRQLWATALFNSWAKFPPSGTLVGTLVDYGDYDQCLELQTDTGNALNSAYCLVDVELPMPKPIPYQHNYFHPTNSLLPKKVENVNSGFSSVHLSNGSLYRYLEKTSSVFYYEGIQIGICWPANCSREDVIQVMSKGR